MDTVVGESIIMFRFILYYGIFAALPVILLLIFLYPKIKHRKIIGYLKPALFAMQYFAGYSLLGLVSLSMISLLQIKPDDASLISIVLYIGISFLMYKYLYHPGKLLYSIIPSALISVILIIIWIQSAVRYGFDDSIGWTGYGLNALPFGFGFMKLLQSESTGFLHILTALLPVMGYFTGAGLVEILIDKSKGK